MKIKIISLMRLFLKCDLIRLHIAFVQTYILLILRLRQLSNRFSNFRTADVIDVIIRELRVQFYRSLKFGGSDLV